ncbi:MAG: tRNA pseudouridine(38-40) synthase TruA [Myxococcota bacterium]
MRYAIVLAYDGAAYRGWQSQLKGKTVQDALKAAIYKITGETVSVSAAGRTDTGVHALGQAAAFTLKKQANPDELQYSLNSVLPDDISVRRVMAVCEDFNPIKDAREKTYRYFFTASRERNPFLDRYLWRVKYRLDIEAMKEASYALIGEHDFSAFKNRGSSVKTTVRRVFAVEWEKREDIWSFSITANGFLKQMVRIIMGTLVGIGSGRYDVDYIEYLLKSGDRRKAGITAPAQGLFFWNVKFSDWESEPRHIFF